MHQQTFNITVIGIGNILLQDEGFGVHAIRKLMEVVKDPDINLIDGGTLGLDLLYFLEDTKNLIVIDAIIGTKKPGEIYRFEGEEIRKHYLKNKLSAHEIGFSEVLALLDLMGKSIPGKMVLIGAQPKSFDVSLEMSEELSKALDNIVDLTIKEIESIKVNMLK